MSLSGAWSRFLRNPASPPDPSRLGGALWRGVAGALGGVCWLSLCLLTVVPALVGLTLFAGVAAQAYAQTLPAVSFFRFTEDNRLPLREPINRTVGRDSANYSIGVRLDKASPTDLTVKYTVDGTATPGSDFTISNSGTVTPGSDFTIANSGTVTVPAGQVKANFWLRIFNDSVHEDSETIVLKFIGGTDYQVGSTGTLTVIIRANDGPPTMSFASASQSAAEDSGTNNVTVNLSPAPAADITLAYTVDGTATSGSDYTALSGTLAVAKGATTATIPVAIVDDGANEDAETVVLTLSAGSGYKVGSPGTHTLTIAASDAPTASFASASQSVQEDSGTSNVTVNLSPAPASDITLAYTVDGTATSGSDYTALSGTVAVPKDATTATIPVAIVDDGANEDAETVVLTLAAGSGYQVGSPDTHTLTIAASDPLTASFASASQTAQEGSGTSNVTVNLSPAPAADITLAYTVDGTATSGSDYTALSGTVAVPKGATTATVPVALIDDSLKEDSETVVLTLATGSGYEVGSPGTHTLTIAASDGPPQVSFELIEGRTVANIPTWWVKEGSGTHDVKVKLNPPPTSDITVKYKVGGKAVSGSDYTALSGTLSVPKGATTVTIPVTIIDDDEREFAEEIVLLLLGGTGYEVGRPDTHTLIIDPSDGLPWVSLVPVQQSAGEGSGTHDVGVRLGPAPATDITFAYRVAGTATSGSDYKALSGSVTVSRGATTATIPVTLIDDSLKEGSETIVLDLIESGGYKETSPGTHTLTIIDDETPTMSFVSASQSVDEGSGTRDVEVRLDPAPTSDITLSYTVDGTATSGSDYTALSGTLSVPKGATTATVPVAVIDDSVHENGETVVLTLAAGSGYAVASPGTHTLSIADDDPAPPPGVDPALVAQVRGYAAETHEGQEHVDRWKRVLAAFGDDNGYTAMTAAEAQAFADGGWQRWVPVAAALAALEAATEPEQPLTLPAVSVSAGTDVTEGGDATFTVTASPAPASPLSVSVTVAAEGDYGIASGTQTVSIPTTGSFMLTLATTGDDADEPDGSVSVTVAAGEGYTVGDPASGTVAIADDDPPPVATVDPALVAQVRGYAAETHEGQAHVDRWKRVLAAFGDDNGYTAMTAAEAQTHADRGWQRWVPVAAALAALEAEQPLTLPAVSVSAGADVTEGGDAVFTVTASPAPASPLAVSVTVAADGDYGVTAGSQSVTIPTGGSATLTLATANDEVDEADGSVTATVNAGEGYTVGSPASGTVAIADNDDAPLPAVTVSAGADVTEGGGATFTVTANPAPASPLTVSVTVAVDGDYGIAAGTQTVSIPTTGSATLTLATANDDADEPDGSATLTVNAGDGYTVGSPASGSVSIADDDLPPPVVSIAAKAASVTEGGAAAFTLTADRAPDADLTVTLSVAETGGGDHVAAADEGPATATIAKGATEAVFSVATVDDDVDEPDGSVTVTLKDGGGYTVSPSQGTAAVTVSDNDAAVGPVLSVDDATGQENGRLPVMPFTVRLSAPARDAVRVYVSTRPSTPVSATPKVDYAPASAALTFRAGETEKQVWVLIHNDSHDEEPETFEVVLSKAQGAPVGDGVAVGTIVNDDPMPAAWLARFGRTVAEQALDGIAGRMSADRTAGLQGSIAGQALSFDPAANDSAAPAHAPDGAAVPGGTGALALADVAQAFGGQSGPGGFGHDAAGFGAGPGSLSGAGGAGFVQSHTMTARDALLGSSFSLTGATDGSGGSMAFWGRAAQGGFDGREGTFSLDGTVTTGMLGADYARGKWLVGLALAQSEGEGDYRDSDVTPRPDGQSCPDGVDSGLCSGAVRAGDGKVEASLTAAIPYAALQASERLKLWGAAGYGSGEVTLKTALGGSYSSDTAWTMAAAGLRGDLLAPPAEGSGPALAVTSDALWTRTSSEKTDQLAASESDATRLRLGLEGSYRMALEGGGSLVPKLEIGARHDGGDAETGFGVELGGGIAWSDPGLGLSLDVSGRTLVAHGNDDLKDRGYAASLAFDPDPATKRGPSLSLRQEFGGQAQGGLDALFNPAPPEDRTGSEATSRWTMEAAYGFPAFGGRFTGSPHVGLGLSTSARDYRLGWRLAPEAASAPDLSFGLKATRRESDTAAPEHTVGLEATMRW